MTGGMNISGRRRRRNSASGRRAVSMATGSSSGYGAYVVMSPGSDVSLESVGGAGLGQVMTGVVVDPSASSQIASSMAQPSQEYVSQQPVVYPANTVGYPNSMAYEQYGIGEVNYAMSNHHAEMAQYFMSSPHPQGLMSAGHAMMTTGVSSYPLQEAAEATSGILMHHELDSLHPAAPTAMPVAETESSQSQSVVMGDAPDDATILPNDVDKLTPIPPQPPLVLVQSDSEPTASEGQPSSPGQPIAIKAPPSPLLSTTDLQQPSTPTKTKLPQSPAASSAENVPSMD